MEINPTALDRNLGEDYRDQTIDAAQAALAAYVLALMLKPKRKNSDAADDEQPETEPDIELNPGDIQPDEPVAGQNPELPPDLDSLKAELEPQFEPVAETTTQAIQQKIENPTESRIAVRAEFKEGTGIAALDENGELQYGVVVKIDTDDTLIVAGVKENLETILDPAKTRNKALDPNNLHLKKIDPASVALADKFGDRIDQLNPDQLNKLLNKPNQPAAQPKQAAPAPKPKPKPVPLARPKP